MQRGEGWMWGRRENTDEEVKRKGLTEKNTQETAGGKWEEGKRGKSKKKWEKKTNGKEK